MNDYSYHTVSSIINAFQKSVNFPFNLSVCMLNWCLLIVCTHGGGKGKGGRCASLNLGGCSIRRRFGVAWFPSNFRTKSYVWGLSMNIFQYLWLLFLFHLSYFSTFPLSESNYPSDNVLLFLLYVPSQQLWSWRDSQFMHPNHTFSWEGLNKRLTSNLCTYFRL